MSSLEPSTNHPASNGPSPISIPTPPNGRHAIVRRDQPRDVPRTGREPSTGERVKCDPSGAVSVPYHSCTSDGGRDAGSVVVSKRTRFDFGARASVDASNR
ncbi:hypothetical protein EVAR_87317_1 [Eumeta japonica]|uniref:Uncharacterized protein n=1 Tax=Eumeta variegata TaxID=151549 RepID=A0A4C1VYM1_EUMVA|nr:hypothetical protein EVAR_87317_1 [Eumeta japonica]